MSFESPQSKEAPAKTAVEKLESGDLSKAERETVDSLFDQAERYGISIHFNNFSQDGEKLDILDNAIRLQEEVDKIVDDLQRGVNAQAYENLSEQDRANYDEIIYNAPEVIKARGVEWRDPKEILKPPSVKEMSQDQLEELMLSQDYAAGLKYASGPVNPQTGEPNPNKDQDPGGYAANVLSMTDLNTRNRHALQEAAALQRKAGKFVNFRMTGLSGEKYLDKVLSESSTNQEAIQSPEAQNYEDLQNIFKRASELVQTGMSLEDAANQVIADIDVNLTDTVKQHLARYTGSKPNAKNLIYTGLAKRLQLELPQSFMDEEVAGEEQPESFMDQAGEATTFVDEAEEAEEDEDFAQLDIAAPPTAEEAKPSVTKFAEEQRAKYLEEQEAKPTPSGKVEISRSAILDKSFNSLKEQITSPEQIFSQIDKAVNEANIYELAVSFRLIQRELVGTIGDTQKKLKDFKTSEERQRYIKDVARLYLLNRLRTEAPPPPPAKKEEEETTESILDIVGDEETFIDKAIQEGHIEKSFMDEDYEDDEESEPMAKSKRVEIRLSSVLDKSFDKIKKDESTRLSMSKISNFVNNPKNISELAASFSSMQQELAGLNTDTQQNLNKIKSTEDKKKYIRKVASIYFSNRMLKELSS